MELWTDDFGLKVNVHPVGSCLGNSCTIHNHSIHPLCLAPQKWNSDMMAMYRQCLHGHFHVDADELPSTQRKLADPDHPELCTVGCDGCCLGVSEEDDE